MAQMYVLTAQANASLVSRVIVTSPSQEPMSSHHGFLVIFTISIFSYRVSFKSNQRAVSTMIFMAHAHMGMFCPAVISVVELTGSQLGETAEDSSFLAACKALSGIMEHTQQERSFLVSG